MLIVAIKSITQIAKCFWKSTRAKFPNRKLIDSIRRKKRETIFFPLICRFVLPPRRYGSRWGEGWRGRGGARREEERTSECLATTMVHAAASQLHPRCTCLPSFCSVPLEERLSEKPNHSSHRFSSIVLATTLMHPSLSLPLPPRAACPTPLNVGTATTTTTTTLSLSAFHCAFSRSSFPNPFLFPFPFNFSRERGSDITANDQTRKGSCSWNEL